MNAMYSRTVPVSVLRGKPIPCIKKEFEGKEEISPKGKKALRPEQGRVARHRPNKSGEGS